MSVLYLVRHGQSEWNRIGRIQGRSESPLTEIGRQQAAALGRLLRATLPDPGIDIVASPLSRAFETATIIAAELGRAAAILVGHSHYDHLGDAPWLARRTGAVLVGLLPHPEDFEALDPLSRIALPVCGALAIGLLLDRVRKELGPDYDVNGLGAQFAARCAVEVIGSYGVKRLAEGKAPA